MALIENIKTYRKMVIEIDEPITDKVIAVQEDAESRYLDVQLFKDGVSFDLTGTKVRICMIKPDGKDVMNDGEITDPTSGRCQFLFTTQMLSACGVLQTQIIVFSETEEQIISTQIFNIYVTKKLLTNETIESTNEYGSLVILFQEIYVAVDAVNENTAELQKTNEYLRIIARYVPDNVNLKVEHKRVSLSNQKEIIFDFVGEKEVLLMDFYSAAALAVNNNLTIEVDGVSYPFYAFSVASGYLIVDANAESQLPVISSSKAYIPNFLSLVCKENFKISIVLSEPKTTSLTLSLLYY